VSDRCDDAINAFYEGNSWHSAIFCEREFSLPPRPSSRNRIKCAERIERSAIERSKRDQLSPSWIGVSGDGRGREDSPSRSPRVINLCGSEPPKEQLWQIRPIISAAKASNRLHKIALGERSKGGRCERDLVKNHPRFSPKAVLIIGSVRNLRS
jgi:hypothetical protein